MTNFTWTVNNLTCYQDFEGKPNAVFKVQWTCSGEELYNNTTYTHSWSENTELEVVIDDTFIPYVELTEEQVLNWVWENGVNKAVIEEAVQEGIEDKKFPIAIIDAPLPWQTN